MTIFEPILKIMKLIRFLRSKTFAVNAVIIVFVAIAGLYLLNGWLGAITDHGEVVVVPDLTTYSLEEVDETLTELSLSWEVLDSSEFDRSVPPGAVVGQYPDAGSEVKRDRTIKLTLNPLNERKLPLPDVLDIPNIDAAYRLESRGFNVGQIRYVPDIGKDNVLAVEVRGEEVEPGTLFEKGTTFDLVLGMGLSSERVSVPMLFGLKLDSARYILRSRMLNVGAVLFDEEVSDSTAAVVYKQTPQPTLDRVIRMGDAVDLWMTEDGTKVPEAALIDGEPIDTLSF